MKRLAISFVIALLFASAAQARGECNGVEVTFSSGPVDFAMVKSARSYFLDGQDHKSKSYVLRGDQLIVGARDGEFVCAQYQSRNGDGASGWIKSADLATLPSRSLGASAWLGKWTASKWNSLEIKKGQKPNWLAVSGEAFWDNSENATAADAMYSGGVDGEAPLIDGTIGFTQTEDQKFQPFDESAKQNYKCAIRLRILNERHLVAEDSGSCGGAHISFSRLYVKAK